MARPPLEASPAAASGERRVGAQPLIVGTLGSPGGSADRPTILLGSYNSRIRYGQDARMRPGVSQKCGSLLPMGRDAVRSLFVDAAAYEPELGALSVNDIVYESLELVTVLDSTLLRKCRGDIAYFVSAVGSSFFTPRIIWLVFDTSIDLARSKGFPRYRICYRCFPLAPRSTWPQAANCKQELRTAITLAPSHTRG